MRPHSGSGLFSRLAVSVTSVGIAVLGVIGAFPGARPYSAAALTSAAVLSVGHGTSYIQINGSDYIRFSVINTGYTALSSLAFTLNLPSGLIVKTPNGLGGTTCGGTVTAIAGSSTIAFSGGSLPATNGSYCQFWLDVKGTTSGVKEFTVQLSAAELASPVTSDQFTIEVLPTPRLVESFNPSTISLGGTTRVTYTVTNPSTVVTQTNIRFTNVLPSGFLTSTPSAVQGSCGTIVASDATSDISMSGLDLAPGASCVFSVSITTTNPVGVYPISTDWIQSDTSFYNGDPDTKDLTVSLYARTRRAPTAVLSYPNGGEIMKAGEHKLVLFGFGGGEVVSARLKLSADDGNSYPTVIADNLPVNKGYFDWLVPAVSTKSAKLVVEGLDADSKVLTSDSSDTGFTTAGGVSADATIDTVANATTDTVVEAARHAVSGFFPEDESASVKTIDDDLGASHLISSPVCTVGTLIKTSTDAAVYYCGADGRRHVFVNDQVFASWFKDSSDVQVVSADLMASLPIGQNVRFHPGTHMVKFQSDPTVYVVSNGGILRAVRDEAMAADLYGSDWKTKVVDMNPAFLFMYAFGNPL